MTVVVKKSRIAISVLALAWVGNAQTTPVAAWVGSWACSPQRVEPQNLPPEPGLAGNTLRQIVHVTLGGRQVRLRFSNEFGATPLVIEAVQIALPDGADRIQAGTARVLTFGGKTSVAIPPGAPVVSDAATFNLPALSDLVITIKAGKIPEALTGHPGSRQTSFLSVGDQVSALSLPNAVKTVHWYVLDGIEVQQEGAAAIVTLGDSLTDGRGSVTDENTRWPDDLARRLAETKHANLAVLNAGIGGNSLLHDGLGPGGLARFDRDVIAQSGVRWVIVLEGVNDIGGSKNATGRIAATSIADELIGAYQQLIARAHHHGLRIYGATLTPFGQSSYFTPATEASRQRVNAWIRSSGTFDAVIDFDAAARDPGKPDQLRAQFDSGDHLHLNSDGYARLAATIDLNLFVWSGGATNP